MRSREILGVVSQGVGRDVGTVALWPPAMNTTPLVESALHVAEVTVSDLRKCVIGVEMWPDWPTCFISHEYLSVFETLISSSKA